MNDDPNDPLNKIKPKPKAQTRPQPSGRPTIVIMPWETERVVDEIEAVLIAAGAARAIQSTCDASDGTAPSARIAALSATGRPAWEE